MIKRTHVLASVFVALAAIAHGGRATPPPVNKPQYCGMTLCVEVIAYSFVESAVIDEKDHIERISVRLADGTRIAFAARSLGDGEAVDRASQDWNLRSPSLAVARQCIGCEGEDVQPLIVGVAVSGEPRLVRTHIEGSLCVWPARYRWRAGEAQPPRIELGARECFPSLPQ